MQNLIVSMLRFSAAVTLFGLEQFEKTVEVVEGKTDLSKTMTGYEKTFNSMTEVLTGQMDEKKKETLKSITKMSEDTVSRSMDGMEVMDPREVLRATSELMQKTSDVTANWVSKTASAVEKATGSGKGSPEASDKQKQPASARS